MRLCPKGARVFAFPLHRSSARTLLLSFACTASSLQPCVLGREAYHRTNLQNPALSPQTPVYSPSCGRQEKGMLSLFRWLSTADTRFCRAERRRQNPGIKEKKRSASKNLTNNRSNPRNPRLVRTKFSVCVILSERSESKDLTYNRTILRNPALSLQTRGCRCLPRRGKVDFAKQKTDEA